MRDRPGLRQRPLAHRVRRLRGIRRRPAVRALDRDARRSASRRSTSTTWSRSRRSARTSASARGSRRSATAASPGRGRGAPRATGLRAIVYLEVFGRDASALDRFHELRARDRARCSRTASASASRPTRRTPARSRSTRLRRARPAAGHAFRRERRRARLARRRHGRLEPARRLLVPPPGETGIRLLAAAGLLGPSLMAAHCVHADAEEIALLAAHGVGVAHCPRSNGYLGCGVAPLDELLDGGRRRSRSQPTAPPRRRRSTCSRSSVTAIVAARARARAARRPVGGGARSSSRRSAAPACSGWTTGSARSCRESRPT